MGVEAAAMYNIRCNFTPNSVRTCSSHTLTGNATNAVVALADKAITRQEKGANVAAQRTSRLQRSS